MAYIPTITGIIDIEPSPEEPELVIITVTTPAGPMKARITADAVRELSQRVERLMPSTGAAAGGP